MTPVLVALGGALIALVVWDVGLTLLHPEARGPLSYRLNRATWSLVRGAAARGNTQRLLSYSGPVAMAVNVTGWILCLWLGFALVYFPFVEQLSFDPTVRFASRGVVEALYLSGVTLTTVGFGDVVADKDPLRFVTILEAASGFGVFTAAVTFVLSVYPLVSAIRIHALHVSDLDLSTPQRAAEAAVSGGPGEVSQLGRDLIESHESLLRFQVLYYFETGSEQESLTRIVRGSAMLCMVLRWGVRHEGLGFARPYGNALERALLRVFEDLERDFVGGRSRRPDRSEIDAADAARALARLRDDVAELDPDLRPHDEDETPEGFLEFIRRADGLLAALAHEHRHEHRPLLADDDREVAPPRAA
jgi:hypothetical protein